MAVEIKRSSALGSLSLTPLIDVVFLLLVFFLVATRFAQEDRELDVILPAAEAAMPLIAKPQEIFVNIDDQGRYFVDGRVIDARELRDVLEEAVVNNPQRQEVRIRADKRVALEPVVIVMDLCNQVGVANYWLTTLGD